MASHIRFFHLPAAFLLVVTLAGCAGTSVFSPYPLQAEAFRQAAGGGPDAPAVMALLDRRRNAADRLLYLMERGRLAQLQGDFAASKADFEQAIALFREQDDRARLSLGGTAAAGSSLLTNDNAIPYRGNAHERVMLHLFQVFNYLGMGDIEGATVELRRAAQVQRDLELQHAGELAKAQGDAAQNHVFLGEFDAHFTGMDGITGHLKNAFQNGYAFYTAAVIWEALGESNSALVDYKKALELFPANEALRADVIRANRHFDGRQGAAGSPGIVVVLHEQGFAPRKVPAGLAVPTTDGGLFSIQFPVYDGSDQRPATPLTVRAAGPAVQTTLLADTGALAVKALREQVPAMLVRQVLRARAKYELQKQAAKQGGVGGQFLANLYNLVSEQADLRSWLTLPANAQAARLELPPGTRTIELEGAGGTLALPVTVRAGRTTLLRVVEVNGRLVHQVFAL